MFLEEADPVVYDFFLAEKLHKTVAEIQQMPNMEYVRWQEYFPIKAMWQRLQRKQAGYGND